MLKRAPKRANHIASILVGFRLIEALESDGPLSLKELSERTGLAPGHAHQYLASFAMLELVGQDPETGRYELGPYALTLGLSAFRRLDVLELAKAPMRRIERETGQTVLLSIWANHGPTIVACRPGSQPIALRLMVGYVLHTQSSTGRVFLACLPKWRTRAIAARDEIETGGRSIASEAELKAIAASGLSETGNDRTDGYANVAVPVFDHDGTLCAALTITGASDYLKPRRVEMRRRMRTAGAELSQRLGWRGTPRSRQGVR